MNTYSHAFFTWALAKHGFKVQRAAAISGAVGASVPDLPAFAATAYYIGPAYLSEGWSSMDSPEVLDAIYFTGPFGTAGTFLHSAVPVGVLLTLYWLLGVGRRDSRGILLLFLIGWLGHVGVDFLTHAEDARPIFWPLSDWRWQSPVSYWNPEYYGREFVLIETGAILATITFLGVRRLLRWRQARLKRG